MTGAPRDRTASVALVHLGCARNLIDSEVLLGRLAEEGMVVAGDPALADIAVLNTCSFIGPAREESEQAVEELLSLKRRGELEGVVVAGCLVQRYRRKLVERWPEVDVFAEISDYRGLARAVRELAEGGRAPRYLEAVERPGSMREGARLLSTPRSYSYLRISHGCDHTCSFCAIPAIRGGHRSKTLDALSEEARELLDAGVRELVLVAEDSTAWGRDLGLELPDLVRALAELEGEHRVRVMYAYPNRFPWELTELLRDHPRVLPYLDMPVQHAATDVLRAMRRAGSGDQVRRILDRLYEEVPGITVRTTLLVGFPGETEDDVGELLDLVRAYGLGRMGAFPFSPEEGTPAFDAEGALPREVIAERYEAVLAARNEVLGASQRELVGEEVEVTIDQHTRYGLVGRTPIDAPEVDPLAVVRTADEGAASVGERVRVPVVDVDEDFNLLCGEGGGG
jgi:ribosomal protein S12 methylthiotransferase